MAQARDIKYINKDFADLRSALINYSKAYFPTTYTDFTETISWYDVYRTSCLCW
jgi:hypothetical protein